MGQWIGEFLEPLYFGKIDLSGVMVFIRDMAKIMSQMSLMMLMMKKWKSF